MTFCPLPYGFTFFSYQSSSTLLKACFLIHFEQLTISLTTTLLLFWYPLFLATFFLCLRLPYQPGAKPTSAPTLVSHMIEPLLLSLTWLSTNSCPLSWLSTYFCLSPIDGFFFFLYWWFFLHSSLCCYLCFWGPFSWFFDNDIISCYYHDTIDFSIFVFNYSSKNSRYNYEGVWDKIYFPIWSDFNWIRLWLIWLNLILTRYSFDLLYIIFPIS